MTTVHIAGIPHDDPLNGQTAEVVQVYEPEHRHGRDQQIYAVRLADGRVTVVNAEFVKPAPQPAPSAPA